MFRKYSEGDKEFFILLLSCIVLTVILIFGIKQRVNNPPTTNIEIVVVDENGNVSKKQYIIEESYNGYSSGKDDVEDEPIIK